MNCVELCIVIFIQENVGEKGYMQLKVRFVIVGMIALINILLKDIEVENCSVNNSLWKTKNYLKYVNYN